MAHATAQKSAESAATPRPGNFPWASLAWFGSLLILCYFPILRLLVNQWMNDEDMGHGFFVPALAGYIAWQRRNELGAVRPQSHWLGIVLVLLGGFQAYVATLGAELFVARTAFIVSLVGVLLFLGGGHLVRGLAFPLFLLCFMIPIPTIVYNQITFPLQLFASQVAESVLHLLNIPVLREGNILELADMRLSVVEACSGIRSLLSLSFLSLVYAYFFDDKVWMRGALLICTVPIAIFANAMRVSLTGIISEYNPELAQGFFHSVEGWIVFMVALTALLAVHQLIDRTYKTVYADK